MNFGTDGRDFAQEIWESGFVGVWYGSWAPQDLYGTYEESRVDGRVNAALVAEALNRQMRQAGSDSTVVPEGVRAAMRFDEITVDTWVFTYFDRTLHFAQVADPDPQVLPQFEHHAETFKAKPIKNKKSFRIDQLPASFLLLPSAGRGNVHRVPSCEILVDLLVNCESTAAVTTAFDSLPWERWMEALGPKSWETLCLGYLIHQYGFLPTGLAVGGTLANFDIVGRFRTGESVYAQCKGNRSPYQITVEDIGAFENMEGTKRFFFAYGGVSRPIPGVVHMDRDALRGWFNNSALGKEYLELLRSKPSLV